MASLEHIFDRIRDACATVDRHWRYQYVNARAVELSGLAVDDMIGRAIWDVFPALVGSEMERALRAAMAGEPQRLRFYFEPQRRWYDQRIHPLDDGLAIVSTDVTEQAHAEARLDAVLSSTPDAFTMVDASWTITYMNSHAREALDGPSTIGRNLWEAYPALLGTPAETMARETMASRRRQQSNLLGPYSQRWKNVTTFATLDGITLGWRDIHDHIISDERFRVLAESMPQIVWTAAPDGTITFINQRWTDFTGLDLAATNAPGVASVFHPDDTERAFTRWSASLASGEPHEVEWRFRRASDGEYRWFLTRALPRRDASGNIVEWFGTATDIHARKMAEQRLRTANQTLDAIVGASPAAIMLLDGDGVVRMWNPAAEKIFGWTADEVIGTQLPSLGPADEDRFRANLARVMAGEVIDGIERTRLTRNGLVHAAIWAAPVRQPDGATLCLSIVADITARRRFEDSERFFAAAGQALASTLDLKEMLDRIASVTLDHLGDWCFVDLLTEDRRHFDRLGSATRIANKGAIARSFLRRYPVTPDADGIARVMATGNAVLVPRVEPGWPASLAVDAIDRDSLEQLEARSFASVPLIVRRHVMGALTILSSTTTFDEHDLWTIENVARQAAAAIENARLFAAERHARERIGRIQQITSALSSATTAEEVVEVTCRIGSHAMEARGGVIWLADDRGRLVMAGSWGTSKEWVNEFRVLDPDNPGVPANRVVKTGEPVFIETRDDYARIAPEVLARAEAAGRVASYAAVPLKSGEFVGGVIVFSHPLGHRYDDGDRAFYQTLAENCQQALQRARLLDEARIANRAKDEFLAMLGHELRNPLAPIVSALELLRLRDTAPQREHAIIERQVQHLRRLVDDLLDVSAIANGRIQLEAARVAMDEIVERAFETTRPMIAQRNHTVDLHVERGLLVDGDAFRLTQVITNLMTNAAKYTPPGGRIDVSARRDAGSITIRVADNGVGISPDLLPRVFDLFQQGPQPSDRSHGGLGLGLAIVRSLVALHGGTVSARSDGPGRGSQFIVALPAADGQPRPAAPSAAGLAHPILTGRRVLIVDDNEDAADLLAEALRLDGAICEVAHTPGQALARTREFAADLALLDLGLPEMDGYELSRALRELQPAMRMIAVSGYGLESDRSRTHRAGFDGHLAKPVDLLQLRQLISTTLQPR